MWIHYKETNTIGFKLREKSKENMWKISSIFLLLGMFCIFELYEKIKRVHWVSWLFSFNQVTGWHICNKTEWQLGSNDMINCKWYDLYNMLSNRTKKVNVLGSVCCSENFFLILSIYFIY